METSKLLSSPSSPKAITRYRRVTFSGALPPLALVPSELTGPESPDLNCRLRPSPGPLFFQSSSRPLASIYRGTGGPQGLAPEPWHA